MQKFKRRQLEDSNDPISTTVLITVNKLRVKHIQLSLNATGGVIVYKQVLFRKCLSKTINLTSYN